MQEGASRGWKRAQEGWVSSRMQRCQEAQTQPPLVRIRPPATVHSNHYSYKVRSMLKLLRSMSYTTIRMRRRFLTLFACTLRMFCWTLQDLNDVFPQNVRFRSRHDGHEKYPIKIRSKDTDF